MTDGFSEMSKKETLLEQAYTEYLEALSLANLRVLGRNAGISNSSSLQKEKLIEQIIEIYTGKVVPLPRTNRGAPAKQSYIDPEITAKIEEIRRKFEKEYVVEQERFTYEVASSAAKRVPADAPVYTGILELTPNGYGFLRTNNCQPSGGNDVFVPYPTIHALKLREGDCVCCTVQPGRNNDSPALNELLSVNGSFPGHYEKRPQFDNLTAQYAKEKIKLSDKNSVLSLRMLDLFSPIGKGQRALIIAPPKAGKTTLLKDIARAICEYHREINLIVLLIDERPEEVTDFRSSVENARVIYSTFDEGAEHHIRAAELAIQHAKRLVEQGKHAMILLDSLTKLTRAYNNVTETRGKVLTGGLDAAALGDPKRFFGAARNTVEGGSLTILATALVETGSRMDDVIYEEFKGTGNCDVFLSRELAERRIFPAIDVRRSGTRKEELLLTEEELSAVYRLRERGLVENASGLIDVLKKTENNAEFVARLPEWLKIYKA